MATILKCTQNVHYYDETGKPAYNAGVKEARKNKYRPSVTTILGIIDNYYIDIWKQEQAIEITKKVLKDKLIILLFNKNGEKIINNFIRDDLEKKLSESAEKGTKIHEYAENFIKNGYAVIERDLINICSPLGEWIKKHIIKYNLLEISFCNKYLNFGGRIDFIGFIQLPESHYYGNAIIDFKSQYIKNEKVKFWPMWAYQLAAYRKWISRKCKFVPFENNYKCISVVVSTNPDFPGVFYKIWPEDEIDRKNMKCRSKITLEYSWNVFKKTRDLFILMKSLPLGRRK